MQKETQMRSMQMDIHGNSAMGYMETFKTTRARDFLNDVLRTESNIFTPDTDVMTRLKLRLIGLRTSLQIGQKKQDSYNRKGSPKTSKR